MRNLVLVLCLFGLVPSALAQNAAPDPVLLARMLATTQADRGNILNALTESQARASMLAEELGKAQAKVKELEAKLKPESKPDSPAPEPPK